MENVPYSNLIGSIMFLMVCTRPDVAYSISCLSRFMSNPGPPHWEALKWLLRYLRGSENIGIMFSKHSNDTRLVGYVDSNYANDRDSRKSTSSYVFTFYGSCISWKSQLQHIVALSTTEAEYIATTEAFKEALWLDGLIKEIGFSKEKLVIFSDSQSSIQLCKNPVFHDRTKHIDVRYTHGELVFGDDEKDQIQTPDLPIGYLVQVSFLSLSPLPHSADSLFPSLPAGYRMTVTIATVRRFSEANLMASRKPPNGCVPSAVT
ncbi:UNVERIFIED_CONTAM: Retrovirus-related Pol polyprotein from transposon TNT 1-94 [Sesamum indicum]